MDSPTSMLSRGSVLLSGCTAGSRWEQFGDYPSFTSVLHVSGRSLCSPGRPHGRSETIEVPRAAHPPCSEELLRILPNILLRLIDGWVIAHFPCHLLHYQSRLKERHAGHSSAVPDQAVSSVDQSHIMLRMAYKLPPGGLITIYSGCSFAASEFYCGTILRAK